MSLRPSLLPKLAVCACYEPNPDAGPQAARGTKLDEIFRRRIHGDRSDDGSTLTEDLSAVDWAIHTLKAIAGGRRIVTADADCKIATQGMTGTVDAWVPELGLSADLKTGQIRNYREQMAAYALGFMEAHFLSEWTTHLLFCDQRQLITLRFSYQEAWEIVAAVIAGYNQPEKEPTPCDYCSWCFKAESCPARLQLAASALKQSDPEFNFELLLADNAQLGQFLTACATLDDFRERAEAVAKERLLAGTLIPGWKVSSRKAPEFVVPDAVGRYIDRLGFGAVLGAYGNMSASKFRQLWEEKMPSEKPFPEDLIQQGKGSVSLRRTTTKTTNR